MINKLIAIAAVVVAPSLATAQSNGSSGSTSDTGNVQQFNGALSSDTTDTTGRDTTRSDTSMMMNRSDTTMMDTMRTDTMMRDTTRADTADTTRFHKDTTTDTSTYRETTEEHGEIAPPPGAPAGRNLGLSTDQVKDLQKAINDAGCHAGPVDGMLGPETREGIACVREQKGIQGEGLNDVLSALGLSFTASPDATVRSRRTGNRFHPDSSTNPESTMSRPDTSTAPSTYQTDTTTTPTMDTTRSMDSSMVTDTTRSMDTTSTMDTTTSMDTSSVMDSTTTRDTTTPPDTSSAYPSTTTTPTDTTTPTNPVDTTMNPMNPMHQTDSTLTRPDTSGVRGRS
jgi:hypothetical protein